MGVAAYHRPLPKNPLQLRIRIPPQALSFGNRGAKHKSLFFSTLQRQKGGLGDP